MFCTKEHPCRILMIEDDDNVVKLFSVSVEWAYGPILKIEQAHRLGDGLKMIGETAYDAVFVDLGLPDSINMDAIDRVVPIAGDIPVFVLSGTWSREMEEAALALGARGYFQKGRIDAQQLISTAMGWMAMQAKLAEYRREVEELRAGSPVEDVRESVLRLSALIG